jgi:hypothetical protein
LTFYQTGSPNPIGSDFVGFATTSNTGTAAQNADYITFSGLANTSFNVYEGATAIGGLDGFIDALVLTGITVDASQAANGFVSNSPALPVPGPLAGAGLPGLVFASSLLAWLRVRRRRGWTDALGVEPQRTGALSQKAIIDVRNDLRAKRLPI